MGVDHCPASRGVEVEDDRCAAHRNDGHGQGVRKELDEIERPVLERSLVPGGTERVGTDRRRPGHGDRHGTQHPGLRQVVMPGQDQPDVGPGNGGGELPAGLRFQSEVAQQRRRRR